MKDTLVSLGTASCADCHESRTVAQVAASRHDMKAETDVSEGRPTVTKDVDTKHRAAFGG